MSSLYQIYYKEDQRHKLFPFSIPYFNDTLTIFFENDPIVKLVRATKADKIGVCSWKLGDKMRIRTGMRGALTPEVMESDFQVLSLTRNSSRHQMIACANAWHPSFLPTISLLWEKLGYKMPGEAKNPIYQNSWIGKSEIYKRYVEEFLSPAMDLVEKDEQLRNMMLQESNYGQLNRNSDLKSVKSKLNLNFYPLCPFIFERCPPLWLQLHGYKISYL